MKKNNEGLVTVFLGGGFVWVFDSLFSSGRCIAVTYMLHIYITLHCNLQKEEQVSSKTLKWAEEKRLMRLIHQLCHGFVGSKNQGRKELMMGLVEAACSPC